MCIICVELNKGNLLPWEASRNLKEISNSLEADHIKEVINLINDVKNEEKFCEYCERTLCECGKNT